MPVVPRPRPSPLLDVPVLGSALGFLEPGEPDVSSLINPLQAPGAIGPRSLTQGILRGHPSMAEILGP